MKISNNHKISFDVSTLEMCESFAFGNLLIYLFEAEFFPRIIKFNASSHDKSNKHE